MTEILPVAIDVDETQRVSGLLRALPDARACLVLAHGAAGETIAKSSTRCWT